MINLGVRWVEYAGFDLPNGSRGRRGSLPVVDLEGVAVLGVSVQADRHLGHAFQVLLKEAVRVEDRGAELVALLDLGGQAPVQLGVQHEGRLLIVGHDLLGHDHAAVLIQADADAAGGLDVAANVDGGRAGGVSIGPKDNAGAVLGDAEAAADGCGQHSCPAAAVVPGGADLSGDGEGEVAGGAAPDLVDHTPGHALPQGVEAGDLVFGEYEYRRLIQVHGVVDIFDVHIAAHKNLLPYL